MPKPHGSRTPTRSRAPRLRPGRPAFRVLALLAWAASAVALCAQDHWVDRAVALGVSVVESPPAVALSWTQSSPVPERYAVYRRPLGAVGAATWQEVVTNLSGTTLAFTDADVTAAAAYEYRVNRYFASGSDTMTGYATAGLRSFAALCGPSNVVAGTKNGLWHRTLTNQAYCFAAGAIQPGWTPNENDFADTPYWAVFTAIFGSYKADWLRNDCEMVAPLANDGYGLTCAWEGIPHWFKHQMGLGATIGYCALRSQLNSLTSDYRPNSRNNTRHMALMGDPTLRMDVVPPPQALLAATNASGVVLTWAPSEPGAVQGYRVYRADALAGPFERLGATEAAGLSFLDAAGRTNAVYYMVRAVKRETGNSGAGYTNLSQGVFTRLTLDGAANRAPVALSMTVTGVEDTVQAITLTGADPDGDPLQFTKLPAASVGTFSGTAPGLVYRPPANWHGTDTVSFVVDDGLAESPKATVTVVVAPANDAPVAQGQSVTAVRNTPVNIRLDALDVEGDVLTYRVESPPSHGSLLGTPPQVTYAPALDYSGSDSFTFTASDGQATSLLATVSLTVGTLPGLMYEGFDYPAGASLHGQAGGRGWGATNAWQSNEEGVDTKTLIVPGLAFSDYPVEGNAVQFYNRLNNSALRAGRQIGTGITNGDLWVSYLYRVEMARTSSQQFSGLQNMATALASGSQRMRNLSQVRTGSGTYGAGGVANSTTDTGANTAYPGTGTYLLIARFTSVDGTAGGETGTWWSVTEAGHDAIRAAGGLSESNLAAHSASTATSTSAVSYLFAPSRFVQFFAINYTTNAAYAETFDELRYASTLADLVPAASGAPSDADGDGMDDAWEIANFGGTNSVKGGAGEDWDNDGLVNGDEFVAGTQPTNPASVLAVTPVPGPEGGGWVLTWYGVTGRSYTVENSAVLWPAAWSNGEGNAAASGRGAVMAWTNVPSAAGRFYRVRAERP